MASRMACDSELRDPTREELYTGPTRELPTEIQEMAAEDTACTFCGVSYFVFAEVQELQATVQKYKSTFRDFVRFLTRERKVSQSLKAEALALNQSFAQLAAQLAAQLTVDAAAHQRAVADTQTQLLSTQCALAQQHDLTQQLQTQLERAADEWRLASAVTEQTLRSEVLDLSSQLETCRLQSSAYAAEVTAELERERSLVRELETQHDEAQSSWRATEQLVVSERDELQQKLLALSKRVDDERCAAQQLETQLQAAQLELARVTAACDADRAANTQLLSDAALLRQQLLELETSSTQQQQHERAAGDATAAQLRAQVAALQRDVDVSAAVTERVQLAFATQLEQLQVEHSDAMSQLQREHAMSVDALHMQQKESVACLQREAAAALEKSVESAKLAARGLDAQLRDAERQTAQWKEQAERSTSDLQHARLARAQSQSQVDALEKQFAALQIDKRNLADENASLQLALETQRSCSEQLRLDAAQHEQQCEARSVALQRRVDALQTQLDDARRAAPTAAPQLAWSDRTATTSSDTSSSNSMRPSDAASNRRGTSSSRTGNSCSSNQESHDFEKTIEKLQLRLEHKDREIALLQQTVHRECLERTSLLERLRSGKVLPDIVTNSSSRSSSSVHTSSSIGAMRHRDAPAAAATLSNDDDDDDDDDGESSRESAEQLGTGPQQQPRAASFYEKLRKAGQRKSKPRK